MTKFFSVLTVLFLVAAGYIWNKNNKAIEIEKEATDLAKQESKSLELPIQKKKEAIEGLNANITNITGEVATLTSEETKFSAANVSLQQSLDDATKKIEEQRPKLEEVREKVAQTGELSNLSSKLKTLNAEISSINSQEKSIEAGLSKTTSQADQVESVIAKRNADFQAMANKQSLPGLKTSIRSSYPEWGFVTLAAGNNQGVVAGSTLDVKRGGETVAKLLVKSVEASSASAAIIPDSLAADTSLQEGDDVVPGEKSNGSKSLLGLQNPLVSGSVKTEKAVATEAPIAK